jgi:hypothetical protein
MAGNFIALCNENEEAPLVVIAGRETFVISLLTRIGYGGQFCCDAHRGALNVLPMTARHPVSCPSMCGEDQIRGSMRCGISGPLWSAQGQKPRRRSGPGTSLCPQCLRSRRNFVHRSERRQVPASAVSRCSKAARLARVSSTQRIGSSALISVLKCRQSARLQPFRPLK